MQAIGRVIALDAVVVCREIGGLLQKEPLGLTEGFMRISPLSLIRFMPFWGLRNQPTK